MTYSIARQRSNQLSYLPYPRTDTNWLKCSNIYNIFHYTYPTIKVVTDLGARQCNKRSGGTHKNRRYPVA